MNIKNYIAKVEAYLHRLPNNTEFNVEDVCTNANRELFKEICKNYILRDENYPHWNVTNDGNTIRKNIWNKFPNPYLEQV